MKNLILALTVVLALTACNGGGTIGPEDPSPSSVEAVSSSVVDQSSSSSEDVILGSSSVTSSSSEVTIPVSSSSVVVYTYNYDSTVTNWQNRCPVEQAFGSKLDSAATWRKIAEAYRMRPGVVLTGVGEEYAFGHYADVGEYQMLLITTDPEIKQWLRLQDKNPIMECAVFQSRKTLLDLQAEGLTYQLRNAAFYGP